MKTKSTRSSQIREALLAGTKADNSGLAAKFKCDPSLVARIRRDLRKDIGIHPVPMDVPPSKLKPEGAVFQLNVKLNPDMELKLRDHVDRMLGTLTVSIQGLTYKRPNQKSNGHRVITWSTLEKLMQLGFE